MKIVTDHLSLTLKIQKERKMAQNNRNKQPQSSKISKRGFASMPHEKVQKIARQGGLASAEKAGHDGMSERGQKGGEERKRQLGHEGYVELGHMGGEARKKQLGPEGYARMGREGGNARRDKSKEGKM